MLSAGGEWVEGMQIPDSEAAGDKLIEEQHQEEEKM